MDNFKLPKENKYETDEHGLVYCWLCTQKVPLDDFSKRFGVCCKCLERKREHW